jgi:hypothetical protein
VEKDMVRVAAIEVKGSEVEKDMVRVAAIKVKGSEVEVGAEEGLAVESLEAVLTIYRRKRIHGFEPALA